MSAALNSPSLPYLGDSETAHLVRSFDWASTSLGPIGTWDASQLSAIRLMLHTPLPLVSLWGPLGVMIYNDAYGAFSGGRHPSLLGQPVLEAWPEIADFNRQILEEVLVQGRSPSYKDQELKLIRHGQLESVWVNLDYAPITDAQGQRLGVMVIVAETTDKVHAERSSRVEKARLQAIIEQSPGFTALLRGPEHRIELVNRGYLELVGDRPLQGLTVAEALPDAVSQGFLDILDHVYRTGESRADTRFRYVVRPRADATPIDRYIDFVCQPFRNADEAVVAVYLQGFDVTERVQAEHALRETHQYHRQVLNSATDYAIVAADLQGRITSWNQGARRLFGWLDEDIVGQSLEALYTLEDRESRKPQQEMGSALEHGQAQREGWHLRRNGEAFWGSGMVTPLRDPLGHPIGFVKVLRDITLDHQAAQAYNDLEQQLQRALEAGGVATFSLDLATGLLKASPNLFRIYGIPPQASLPVTELERLVSLSDRPKVADAAQRARGEAPLDVEYCIWRAHDGERRFIARKAEYEFDAMGKPIRMVGIVRDITEQRLAEQALAEREAEFKALAQAVPNHVWTAQPDGRIDWLNDTVHRYGGVKPGGFDSDGWIRLVHAEDRPEARQRWRHALQSGDIFEIELRLKRYDGGHRWHIVRALPIRDPQGRITRWVGSNTDIDAQTTLLRANLLDRNRLWTLSQDLMLVCEFSGTITAVNPSCTRLLGWEPDDMVGRNLQGFVHPDDLAPTRQELLKLSAGATTLSFENRFRTLQGEHRLLSWTAVPSENRVHAVGRDITDQRITEAALHQSQKMEAVGQLTGGIAHDFNNLLQGITGSLDLTRKLISLQRAQESLRFIDSASTSARKAAALTHRLLAFSRRQPLDPRQVPIHPLLQSMEDLLRRTLGEHIALQLALDEVDLVTRCDANQLESALLNLAINARDAMPNGGKLTLTTFTMTVSTGSRAAPGELAPGEYAGIAVSDTGTGMSAETRARAFEPFFTTKPLGQGTGLGLSMIYGFTQQSGGTVTLSSEPDHGSTVTIYLPRVLGDAAWQEEAAAPVHMPSSEAAESILVVEDEDTVRELMVELLRNLGYRVTEAVDGPGGLAILQSGRRIDLLLTDVGLPGLNGRQLADAARVDRPHLKVLFMTGYAENAGLQGERLAPGMSLITKPFPLEDLASRVRSLLTTPEAISNSGPGENPEFGR